LIEPDYRRHRIEVNAVVDSDRWNANVMIRRTLSPDIAPRPQHPSLLRMRSAELHAVIQRLGIPIVMVGTGDPVKAGLVPSLARPRGNITGNTILGPDIGAKRLQLLREALPKVSRVAMLWNPQNASNTAQFYNVQRAAPALGLTLLPMEVSSVGEL